MMAFQLRPSTPINDAELAAGKSKKLWNDKLSTDQGVEMTEQRLPNQPDQIISMPEPEGKLILTYFSYF